MHIFDFFAQTIPRVSPVGDANGSALLLDVLKFAEDLAAFVHIDQPVGLIE